MTISGKASFHWNFIFCVQAYKVRYFLQNVLTSVSSSRNLVSIWPGKKLLQAWIKMGTKQVGSIFQNWLESWIWTEQLSNIACLFTISLFWLSGHKFFLSPQIPGLTCTMLAILCMFALHNCQIEFNYMGKTYLIGRALYAMVWGFNIL